VASVLGMPSITVMLSKLPKHIKSLDMDKTKGMNEIVDALVAVRMNYQGEFPGK